MSELTELYEQVRNCTRCSLAQGRTRAVPGEGPENAMVMFIGEAPGFHEDKSGRPFVGAAGRFLEELLADIDMQRQDVYIANVIKCRPPSNRDPQPEEIVAITFTRKAADEMVGRVAELTKGVSGQGGEPTITTFHAFALQVLYSPHQLGIHDDALDQRRGRRVRRLCEQVARARREAGDCGQHDDGEKRREQLAH